MNVVVVAAAITLHLLQLGFERVDARNGVVVYHRAASRHLELGVEGDLPAPPERVREVLLDYGKHPDWVKGVAASQVLKRNGADLVVYQRLGLPVIADRDFTLRVTWGCEGDVLWARFTTRNDLGPPPVRGVVRVGKHDGEWRLIPIDGGRRTHAIYRFDLDLGGSLPGGMGRDEAVRDLVALFEQLRARL